MQYETEEIPPKYEPIDNVLFYQFKYVNKMETFYNKSILQFFC